MQRGYKPVVIQLQAKLNAKWQYFSRRDAELAEKGMAVINLDNKPFCFCRSLQLSVALFLAIAREEFTVADFTRILILWQGNTGGGSIL